MFGLCFYMIKKKRDIKIKEVSVMGIALSTAVCKAKKKVCFDKTRFLSLINNACINLSGGKNVHVNVSDLSSLWSFS